jgi:hypothetical protein
VAFDKVREVFQRADVILSPLRLPVPPRPRFDCHNLFALYLQMLDSQSVALDISMENLFTSCPERA